MVKLMALFQCDHCGCIEKTHLSHQAFCIATHNYDWSYAPERKGMRLCSACGPVALSNGTEITCGGQWHNKFPRYVLPLKSCFTDDEGNVIHKDTNLPVSQFVKQFPEQVTKLE